MSTLKIYDGSTWQAVGGIGSSGYSGYSGTSGTAGAVNPNIFINGDLNVWQRGTSFTSIAGTSYFADRFRYLTSAGQNVWNATRETDVPSLAQSSHLSNYSMKMACTTKEDAVAAAEVTYIRVAIEGYDYAAIAQQAFTVSFWVKAYKAGIYCFAVFNSGADRSYVAEYTINASNTWEKKTVTITASPAAGTWDYTTGVGIYMNWTILSGATYQTTANTWATGQYIATSNQVNGADSTSNTFFLSQIKLEPGSSATQFMGEPAAVELERCQRYFYQTGGTAAYEMHAVGYIPTTSIAAVMAPIPVMRVQATLGYTTVGNFCIGYGSNAISACTALARTNSGNQRVFAINATATATPLTAGSAAWLASNNNTTDRLTFSAEI